MCRIRSYYNNLISQIESDADIIEARVTVPRCGYVTTLFQAANLPLRTTRSAQKSQGGGGSCSLRVTPHRGLRLGLNRDLTFADGPTNCVHATIEWKHYQGFILAIKLSNTKILNKN